jgi:hypothetical protein
VVSRVTYQKATAPELGTRAVFLRILTSLLIPGILAAGIRA